MIDISSGAFWMMLTVIGVALLGAFMAWGAARNRGRDRRNDALTDAATRAQYDDPEAGDKTASANPDRRLGTQR
ncbi:MAG TPA: hypothetical protein VIO94_04255 [Phenylobacterium sp.]